ncbi:MAG: galactose-1-phosphate uridylyltransferase [Granulosicoccus sp.]
MSESIPPTANNLAHSSDESPLEVVPGLSKQTTDSGNQHSTHGEWEQRWHPLLQEWVIFSAHRQNRPWTGEQIVTESDLRADYDKHCYLCPGNTRVSGIKNKDYSDVYVFDNDRPSISFDAPSDLAQPTGIYRNKPATGLTRVLCYSPQHNLTMAELETEKVGSVVKEWQNQTRLLGEMDGVNSITIFENKGEVCGMSNPHPHGQIYATNFIYKTVESHLRAADEHYAQTGKILFQDILAAELEDATRLVAQNDTMVAFVPYFARFAYEIYIAPKRTVAHITALNEQETSDLASLLHEVLIRLDNLWSMPFPYLMMLQQAPVDGREYPLYHFHIALYPPLRTPSLRKYVAAHEIGGGNFLADTMPEAKAAELRATSTTHHSKL